MVLCFVLLLLQDLHENYNVYTACIKTVCLLKHLTLNVMFFRIIKVALMP